MAESEKRTTVDKSVIKALALGGTQGGGAPCVVDVKNGKAVRVRPLHYDWKYDLDTINQWKLERNGKVLRPIIKSVPSPFSLAYKKRVYSPNRIKYPLKRVDWDPSGERNTQTRGSAKYKRISWDEATDIIAAEIKRVHKEYGPYAVLTQTDGHSECKHLNPPHGACTLLLSKLGGYTQQVRNADSWEGWYWGSKHVWGDGNVGMMSPAQNVAKDIIENCDMVICWGGDLETTPWGFGGQQGTFMSYYLTEAGIPQIFVCPDLNYACAIHADKWIPVLPNTDAAVQLAVIYTWIKEGTYDKDYVATHTVGFDQFKAYVMGEEDGIEKSPEWAAPKSGVPEWTIKALARQFAAKCTSIIHYFGGGMIRGPWSTEPARLESIMLGMQGLGGPGVHQAQLTLTGMPRSDAPATTMRLNQEGSPPGPLPTQPRLPELHFMTVNCYAKQNIPKTMIEEAILNPPLTYWGHGSIRVKVEDQFVKYTYPIPKEEGGSEIHMIWTDSPCRTTCWGDGMRTVEAMRHPKIEFILAQHPWMENDCFFADIILPVNTTFEVEDLVPNTRPGIEMLSAGLQHKAIEPIGESMSDYEAVLEVAKKLDMYDEVTEGKTMEEWKRHLFDDYFKLNKYTTWEEFNEKEYMIFPAAEDWEEDPPGFRLFYEDPESYPLPTPSGKLEFYSQRLADNFPEDVERPPIPKWVEKGPANDERLTSPRARMFPLLAMSNHGRWRMHAQCDDITWDREVGTCKRRGNDGYLYEPLWMHPQTAEERGIKDGDIVKAYNERGTVLFVAYVWERIIPGAVYADHGSRVDWIIPGKLDRGGAINLIGSVLTSKHAGGQSTTGYLVEVAKVTGEEMDQWRRDYPEAFERAYDPAAGLRFDAWVEGE